MADETTTKSSSLGTIAAVAGVAAVAAVFGMAMDYDAGADEFSKVAEKARAPAVKPVSAPAAEPMKVSLNKETAQTSPAGTGQPEQIQTAAAATVAPQQVAQVQSTRQTPPSAAPFDPAPAGMPAAGAAANNTQPSVLSYPAATTPVQSTYPAPVTQAPAYPSPPPGSAVPAPVTAPAATPYPPAVVTQQSPAQCGNCGTVENVVVQSVAGEASGLGAVIGGVAGGLLGNQVGRGTGRTVATVAGVAGGAYAGHQIERRTSSGRRYEVVVRMEDGSTRVFPYDTEPAFRAGERVRIIEGRLQYN